jgi:hypothetical protein
MEVTETKSESTGDTLRRGRRPSVFKQLKPCRGSVWFRRNCEMARLFSLSNRYQRPHESVEHVPDWFRRIHSDSLTYFLEECQTIKLFLGGERASD